MSTTITRRRFITISASAGAFALSAANARASLPVHHWRGLALGAEAEIRLYHEHPADTAALMEDCRREVSRLEKIFSLYRADSAVSRLNGAGELADPPLEFVELLSRAASVSRATDGAFDVTMQPLWRLYADHFSAPDADPAGPTASSVSNALERVGYQRLHVDTGRIEFAAPHMAVSLNGIAQGYITDRIADLLHRAGMRHVLVHMGETRALGAHPDGSPWRIGLKDPAGRLPFLMDYELKDAAVATSGGYGFQFTPDGVHHHILDPRTGSSPGIWRQVSVVAEDAATADALSTAAMMMSEAELQGMAERFSVRIIALSGGGTVQQF